MNTNGERIGVYICHCGTNIAGTVNVAEVAEYARTLPQVAVVKEYKYMCSDPGQALIKADIEQEHLDRVVVSSCSPLMHEDTFRGVCEDAGLNKFLFQMSNIREQCSWVHADKAQATDKAKRLIAAAVNRVARHEALEVREVPVQPTVMVIGGGIAGIEAALKLADAGKKVCLVERSGTIGGHMAKFDKTFPTLDCAACILTPKMVSVGQHPNIELMTYSEVEEVSGYVGNFKIKVRRKARYVDEEKCTGCGQCVERCPVHYKPVHSPGQAGIIIGEEPCILCGKCVRMCDDVMKVGALSLEGKGKQRHVVTTENEDEKFCMACGACSFICPTGAIEHQRVRDVVPEAIPSEFDEGLSNRKPCYIPFPQAVPRVPIIDKATCMYFETGGCKICEDHCEVGAIDHHQQDHVVERDIGAIIVATGFSLFDAAQLNRYGYGRLDNVLTALEFERMSHASGPTGGKIVTQKGTAPQSVAILHCIGSRDENHLPYCSRVCCMYSLKFAHLVKEKTEAEVYNCYLDMRAFGKGYEEFYKRLLSEGVQFIRGKAAEVTDAAECAAEKDKLVVVCEDTLLGITRRIPADMVILSGGLKPAEGAEALARVLGLSCSQGDFYLEKHPKLAPVDTASDGIYLAGACQGPKDIPDAVAQGAAAAAGALSLINRGKIVLEPITAEIDETLCSGCRFCISNCPFNAIEFDAAKSVSVVAEELCKGCGTCVAGCPSGAASQRNYNDAQIFAELSGLLETTTA